MGDPVGIGPEVIAKALSVAEVRAWADLVVYGDPGVIEQICREAQISVPVTTIDDPNCGTCECICVRPVSDLGSVTWASSTPSADRAQLDYIEAAVADIQSGLVDALVTAPITKASIRRAGAPWPGHTEMLAHLVGLEDTSRPVMMLVGEQLRTVPLTIHCPLSEVPGRLTSKLVRDGIDVTNRALRTYFGQSKPRIAVAGLNPHAGEGGLFGNEEAEVIEPAVAHARAAGVNVTGPLPGDTVFRRAADGDFDAVIAMYHDQALIPIKLLEFDRAVNVTLGLPIIRTSVDHGTAYDIAGQGIASARSMISAVGLATKMIASARSRR